MSNLPSDPYLAALLDKYPKFEKPFYQFLLDNQISGAIENFANTPTWVLMSRFEAIKDDNMRTSLVSHPNFDLSKLAEIISTKDPRSSLAAAAAHNPKITNDQLKELAAISEFKWAEYYLLRNTVQIHAFIEEQLSLPSDKRLYTLGAAVRENTLTEDLVLKIIKYADQNIYGSGGDTIGSQLVANESLSEEQRAMLSLLGIHKKQVDNSYLYKTYPSSEYIIKKSEINECFVDEITDSLFHVGHPFGLLSPTLENSSALASNLDISQLVRSEFLHRMFWIELSNKVNNLGLTFRNGYRFADLFVEHPTLSLDFDETEYDEGSTEGGVVYGFQEREWIIRDEYLDPDQVEQILTHWGEETISDITQDLETIQEAQPYFLAFLNFTKRGKEICSLYEVTLTNKGTTEMINEADNQAEPDSYDVDATINSEYNEFLSWENLPNNQKSALVQSLLVGFNSEPSKLQRDCEHFLACIALHPNTSTELLKSLQNLNSRVISETLAIR